jgi:hypothetical protein
MIILLVRFDIISTGVLLFSSSSPFSYAGGSWGNERSCTASCTVASSSLLLFLLFLSFLVVAGEEMLIDYLILDNEKVNPMLFCNQQWFIQKNITITRTPTVGVLSAGSLPKSLTMSEQNLPNANLTVHE